MRCFPLFALTRQVNTSLLCECEWNSINICGLSVPDVLDHVVYEFLGLSVLLKLFADLCDRVENGGVVSAAEEVADLLYGEVGKLSGDVNRDVARVADVRLLALLLCDVLGSHAVGARYLVDNAFNCDLGRNVVAENVRDDLLNGVEGGLLVVEEGLRLEVLDGALELADI